MRGAGEQRALLPFDTLLSRYAPLTFHRWYSFSLAITSDTIFLFSVCRSHPRYNRLCLGPTGEGQADH